MVNHIYDELADATLCQEMGGPTAYVVSSGLHLEGDPVVPPSTSCVECINEHDVRYIRHLRQRQPTPDVVNSPDHYTWLPVEAIEITELFSFTLGNALKYILRADHKGKPVEDLLKARWYLDREIARREKSSDTA